MLWRKQPPAPVFVVQVDGDPVAEVTIDSLMAMAAVFRNTPGLQQAWMAQFCDTMDVLEKLPADANGERIRLAERACGLWRALRIPHVAVAQANTLKDAQRAERGPDSPKAPPGLTAAM